MEGASLILDDNHLSHLPDLQVFTTGLLSLSASCNSLEHLPPSLPPTLTSLDLTMNLLTCLPPSLSLLSLQVLKLGLSLSATCKA